MLRQNCAICDYGGGFGSQRGYLLLSFWRPPVRFNDRQPELFSALCYRRGGQDAFSTYRRVLAREHSNYLNPRGLDKRIKRVYSELGGSRVKNFEGHGRVLKPGGVRYIYALKLPREAPKLPPTRIARSAEVCAVTLL